ncbi:YfiT family bacillithiol transferase [Deinococcus yavapaiensis]|uniref:Putative metal-dependent hydrolase DES52_1034 n=1 Tax=Deinococcus yavapaiensis KR-236 TaxID=694435 RepID=A0A318S900_9DEIO|nr:putative metal-dependent hydrolase [Deinococcus yavapaiensis]PYE55175.1 putative damage-inducible protein DinB [Deinococcus yavapaiensis KR-236]
MSDPRYPIGRPNLTSALTPRGRTACIDRIAELPGRFRAALGDLSDEQLDAPYREGGWTLRQLAHHVPDSHLNAYVRTKLALTEDAPTIKPYNEEAWANLPDSVKPIEPSLQLLEALHERWTSLLRSLPDEAWARTFVHPESRRSYTLDELVQLYAWHGEHHLAHASTLRTARQW